MLRLSKWARSLTILFSWLRLVSAVSGTIGAALVGQRSNAVGEVLGGLFAVWMLWYLSKPEVILVFQLHENLDLRESLNLRYRVRATEGAIADPNPTTRDLEANRNETKPVSVTLFGRKIDM